MNRRGAFLLVAIGAAALAGIIWWVGLAALDPETLAARIRSAGWLGPLVLLALLVLQCVVAPIPSEPVMMAAGYVYGPALSLALSWLGVVIGASACFGLARGLGRPFVHRFVRAERLASIDTYLQSRGQATAFAIILAIRLFAFASFDVVSYGCGLVSFRFRWFLVATAIGVIPKAFAFTYAGATMGARPAWLDAMILAGVFGIVFLVPWVLRYASRWQPDPITPDADQ